MFSAHAGDSKLQPFLNRYCSDCHDEDLKKGSFSIEDLAYGELSQTAQEPWTYIYDMVSSEDMPPKKKKRQPSEQEREDFLKLLEQSLEKNTAQRVNQEGRTAFRRLTAEEYEYTLIDLMKIPSLRVKGLLPNDRSAEGFDNTSHEQSLSYVQINSYMDAAEKAMSQAMFYGKKPEVEKWQTLFGDGKKFPLAEKNSQTLIDGKAYLKQQPTDLMIQTRWTKFKAPYSGTYKVSFKAYAARQKEGKIIPANRTHTILLARGRHQRFNIPIDVFTLPIDKCKEVLGGEYYLDAGDEFIFKIGTMADKTTDQLIGVDELTIEGPIYKKWPSESHETLFGYSRTTSMWTDQSSFRQPEFMSSKVYKPNQEEQTSFLTPKKPLKQVENLIRDFAARAFRYPVSKEEVDKFVGLFKMKYNDGFSFQDSIKVAYQGILCSPYFLFFTEGTGELNDFELASRLSYFLWKSMPDKELRELAVNGRLKDETVLSEQIERMILDPKFKRFIKSFADQWLSLDAIDATTPDKQLYPEFDTWLMESLAQETYAYLNEMVKENLGAEAMVSSNFLMINERLAKLYDIPNVNGSYFRKVPIENSIRGGLVTQAGILKVTANGATTSPVNRGVWFYEKILGKRVPPPPPVAAFEPDSSASATLREQFAKHRENASCATCHDKFDPLGFSLESFDVIGRFREEYRALEKGLDVKQKIFGKSVKYKLGQKVDASGKMLSGETFKDLNGMRQLLLKDKEMLAENLTSRLLEFATGAKVEFTDRKVIQDILKKTKDKSYGFRSLIQEVILSDTFRHK